MVVAIVAPVLFGLAAVVRAAWPDPKPEGQQPKSAAKDERCGDYPDVSRYSGLPFTADIEEFRVGPNTVSDLDPPVTSRKRGHPHLQADIGPVDGDALIDFLDEHLQEVVSLDLHLYPSGGDRQPYMCLGEFYGYDDVDGDSSRTRTLRFYTDCPVGDYLWECGRWEMTILGDPSVEPQFQYITLTMSRLYGFFLVAQVGGRQGWYYATLKPVTAAEL